MNDDLEPIERLEEISPHPADRTFNTLHDQGLSVKKQLCQERDRLSNLLQSEPSPEVQKEIQAIKASISQKHNELMEILKLEEKICREITETEP